MNDFKSLLKIGIKRNKMTEFDETEFESKLETAGPEIYSIIRRNLERFVRNNREVLTIDKLMDEDIEEMYNREETFTKKDEYEPEIMIYVESVFEIVKIVSNIHEEDFGINYKFDTIEKTVDAFAYLCAREIGYELIEKYNIPEIREI